MSNAKPLDLSLPYQVADISLADFGKKEMQLSEREMPGLMELIRRYGDKKPLKGFKVMGSLHADHPDRHAHQDAVRAGADIRWASCNIFSRRITLRAAIAEWLRRECSRGRVKRLRIIDGEDGRRPDGSGPDLIWYAGDVR
ncbi:MAG: adenosylhomocysteinase [Bilophila wadsworthia]